jgi:hypothetical protein
MAAGTRESPASRQRRKSAFIEGFSRSADFQVCCAAGFQACSGDDFARRADLKIGDTADLEVCATEAGLRPAAKGIDLQACLMTAAQGYWGAISLHEM